MGRSPSRDESGLKKGPWTPEEDEKLVNYIQENGHGSWRALPKLAGLNRCGKSCRLRWTNYLRPDIKRGKFSEEEEQIILKMHSVLGNKWSAIAGHLPGRTDNEIKNFWNTHLKKKLIQMGIDPMTHRPRTDIFSSLPQLLALASLRELIGQYSWDEHALRLQAETTQMAIWLQNLQSMSQPPQASLATIPNNSTHFTDMETMNMLNSLSSIDGNSVSNSHMQSFLGDSSLQGVLESIPFSHLPDLQDPSSDQTSPNKQIMTQASHDFTLFSHGECSSNSQWIPPSATPPPNPIGIPTQHNNANSSSNAGGVAAPLWDDLLFEDPWFHESA